MRINWLDTMRVFAALSVIISHYAYVAGNSPAIQHFFHKYIFGIGGVGNILFFAVSGYLAANSLEHSNNIFEFYRRKLIRIVVPFATAYILISLLWVLLQMLNPSFSQSSPLYNIVHAGGSLRAFFVGMLPIDINLITFFHLPNYPIIGEWFIGTVVFLYLLSPLLYKCVCKNFCVTFIASVILALIVFDIAEDWQSNGYIRERSFLFPVHIPQFLIGMILFVCQDFLLKHRKVLVKLFSAFFMILIGYGLYLYPAHKYLWLSILSGYPVSVLQTFFTSLVITYLFYALSMYLNEHFTKFITPFNEFSNISYMAMLIHHAIIYRLNSLYNFSTLSKFGALFFLLLTIFLTVFLSEQIKKVYKPLEERCIKGGIFLWIRQRI